MRKKVIDLIGGEAVVYYEGGDPETVPILLPSNSLKLGEPLESSNTLTSRSHIKENQLVQRELNYY